MWRGVSVFVSACRCTKASVQRLEQNTLQKALPDQILNVETHVCGRLSHERRGVPHDCQLICLFWCCHFPLADIARSVAPAAVSHRALTSLTFCAAHIGGLCSNQGRGNRQPMVCAICISIPTLIRRPNASNRVHVIALPAVINCVVTTQLHILRECVMSVGVKVLLQRTFYSILMSVLYTVQ